VKEMKEAADEMPKKAWYRTGLSRLLTFTVLEGEHLAPALDAFGDYWKKLGQVSPRSSFEKAKQSLFARLF
jgi:hypothetical protein